MTQNKSSTRMISDGTKWKIQVTSQVSTSYSSLVNLAHHKAIEHNGFMWVFGGNSNGLGNRNIYKLNLESFEWTKLDA